MHSGAPAGIRTRVADSKGLHDWPLHYGSKVCVIIRQVYLNLGASTGALKALFSLSLR
jgi:hypothetical protein